MPLVGRDQELATLARLSGVTQPPASGLVLLSGDAGIGKSRLVAALADRASKAGWRVAVGHCVDLGGSPLPYLPFSEVTARLEANRPELMARLATRWPALRRLLAGRPGAPMRSEPLDRADFFESLHAVLAELGREAPLLLVIEDLHWADRSTCDLLTYLFARGFSVPVSVVATYRSDDLHRRHPLRTIAAGWTRLPGMMRLELGPLPDDRMSELVAALHPEPLGDAALQTILDRAEGNAFFAEELVAAVGSRTVPRDLAGLLLLRLDSLDVDARLVVRAASAAGRSVRDSVLAAVTALPPDQFGVAIRSAVEYLVLVAEDDGYRFRHSMLAEAVYEDLLPGERRRLHAAYAGILSAPSVRRSAADLARHALAAEDHVTAFTASVQAGDEATAAGGPDEAARHYALALDLLDHGLRAPTGAEPPVLDLVTLTEKAASAAASAGYVVRAESLVSDQLRRLPPDAAPLARARLLIALVEAAVHTDSALDLVTTAQEAVDLVPAEPPTALRARAVATLGTALAENRRDAEAVRWLEEGLALSPSLRPGAITTQLQTVLARVSERSGRAAESEQLLRDLLDATRGSDDGSDVRVLYQLGWSELEQGELVRALATLRRAAERSAQLGRPFAPYGAGARALAGLTAYQLGEWDLALDLADAGAERPPSLAAAGLACVTLAVRAGRGQAAGCLPLLAQVRAEWTTDGMVGLHGTAAAIDLLGDSGRLPEALTLYDELIACLGTLWGSTDFQAQIRLISLLLGQMSAALPTLPTEQRDVLLSRAEELAVLAAGARGMGRRHEPGAESRAWLARSRAERLRLRAVAGLSVDPGEAVAAWQDAVEAFTSYGQPYEQARSQARLAVALRAIGDASGSAHEARSAEEVALRLGAKPLLAELRPLTRTRPASEPVDLLTPRESEVLALVAAGLSNGEIGAALFVSAKTASVHVSNILAKLSARTRTEAAAIARRRGLVP